MINRKHIHTNPKKGWTYSNVELSHKSIIQKYVLNRFEVVVMFSKTLPGCPVAGGCVAVTSAWPSWPSPGEAWGSHPTLLYSTQTWMTGGVHYKMLCTRFYSSLPMGEPRLMPGQCRPYQVYPSLSNSKNHMIKKTKEEPLRLTEYHRILSRTRFVQWKTCPLWFCSSGEWGRWFCSVCFSKSLPVWRPTSDGCGTASSSGLSAAASSPGMLRPLLKLSTHSLGPQKMINRKQIHTNPYKSQERLNIFKRLALSQKVYKSLFSSGCDVFKDPARLSRCRRLCRSNFSLTFLAISWWSMGQPSHASLLYTNVDDRRGALQNAMHQVLQQFTYGWASPHARSMQTIPSLSKSLQL